MAGFHPLPIVECVSYVNCIQYSTVYVPNSEALSLIGLELLRGEFQLKESKETCLRLSFPFSLINRDAT